MIEDQDMSDGSPRRLRVIGAVTGAALPALLLGCAAVLLIAAVSAAWVLVLIGAVGIVAGPLLGWRYGPSAARDASGGWTAEAGSVILVIEASLIVGWAFLALVGPEAETIAALAYIVLMGIILSAVVTATVVLPLGLVWIAVVRRVGKRMTRVGS